MSTQEVEVIEQTGPRDLIHRLSDLSHDPKVQPDKLHAILDFQERLEAREAKRIYDECFFAVQAELPNIVKDGKIDMGGKGVIPFATFENVMGIVSPILKTHGFAYGFTSADSGDKGVLVKLTMRQKLGGHSEFSEMRLPADEAQKTTIKGIGSARSFAKRYLILDMLAIVTVNEDDDAESAQKAISPKQTEEIRNLMIESEVSEQRFLKHYGIGSIEALPASQFGTAVSQLRTRIANQKAAK